MIFVIHICISVLINKWISEIKISWVGRPTNTQDTSLLLRESLVVLSEAEDRFVHSVLWSLGSPIPPSLTRFMAQDVKTPQMSAFCLLFLNGNIFKIWSKKYGFSRYPLASRFFQLCCSSSLSLTRCTIQDVSKRCQNSLMFAYFSWVSFVCRASLLRTIQRWQDLR